MVVVVERGGGSTYRLWLPTHCISFESCPRYRHQRSLGNHYKVRVIDKVRVREK